MSESASSGSLDRLSVAVVKSERLEVLLTSRSRLKLERAAALAGTSLSEYVVRAAEADANRMLAEGSTITLPDEIFDRFMAGCNEVSPPNEALARAAKLADKRGIE